MNKENFQSTNRNNKNKKRSERSVLGRQKATVQMKLALKEIDKINQSKKKERIKGSTGIHSYNQMRHATSASRNFIAFVHDQYGINQMQSFTMNHYAAYIEDMQQRALSDGHIRNVETALSQLQKGFNARQARLRYRQVVFIPKNRLVAYKAPQVQNRSYTDEEYEQILKNATEGARGGIELMREMGLRVREAANVRVEHFTKKGDSYFLEIKRGEGAGITKGGRYRYIPVSERFTQRLEQMLQGKDEMDPLIKMTSDSLRSAVRDACKKVGVKQNGRGTHGFRHRYTRERAEQLMTDLEWEMMKRVLENMSDGKLANYSIFTEADQKVFADMKKKMDQIHSEIGHGKNRYHLAMVYLKEGNEDART